MLYPDVTLPVPEEAILAGPKKLYVYLRLEKAQAPGKRKTVCKQISIGKLVDGATKQFHPNDNFYTHYGLTPPEDAVPLRVGRKTHAHAVPTAEEAQARARRRKCLGSYLVLKVLADDLGLSEDLAQVFGAERASDILSLVPYFALGCTSSCDMLDMFTQFSVRGAGRFMHIDEVYRLFDSIGPAERDAFLDAWKRRIGTKRPIVHFAPTLPHRGDRFFDAFMDLDAVEDFTMRIAVVLSRDARLPIHYFPIDGPLLGGGNIPRALDVLKGLNLGERCPMVLALDLNEADLRTLSGLDMPSFVFTARKRNFPEIVDVMRKWWKEGRRKVVLDEVGAAREFGEYPFRCGPLDGRLFVFVKAAGEREDLERKVAEIMAYLRVRVESASTHRPPAAVLDLCDLRTTSQGRKIHVPNVEKVRDFARMDGTIAAFTTDMTAPVEEILRAYFQGKLVLPAFVGVNRDTANKTFHLHMGRELDGKIFVLFLALILRMELLHKLESISYMTLARCLKLLDALHFAETDGRWEITNAISADQRKLLEALDLANGYPRPSPAAMAHPGKARGNGDDEAKVKNKGKDGDGRD